MPKFLFKGVTQDAIEIGLGLPALDFDPSPETFTIPKVSIKAIDPSCLLLCEGLCRWEACKTRRHEHVTKHTLERESPIGIPSHASGVHGRFRLANESGRFPNPGLSPAHRRRAAGHTFGGPDRQNPPDEFAQLRWGVQLCHNWFDRFCSGNDFRWFHIASSYTQNSLIPDLMMSYIQNHSFICFFADISGVVECEKCDGDYRRAHFCCG